MAIENPQPVHPPHEDRPDLSPWDFYANGDYRDGYEGRRALRRGGLVGVWIICSVFLSIETLPPEALPKRHGLHLILQGGGFRLYTSHGSLHYLGLTASLALLTITDWRALFHALGEWRRLPWSRDALTAWTIRFARPLSAAVAAGPALWYLVFALRQS